MLRGSLTMRFTFTILYGAVFGYIGVSLDAHWVVYPFLGWLSWGLADILVDDLEVPYRYANQLRNQMDIRLTRHISQYSDIVFYSENQETSDRVVPMYTVREEMQRYTYCPERRNLLIVEANPLHARIIADSEVQSVCQQIREMCSADHTDESEGVLPPSQSISDAVASGEIQSAGKSVSVDDVIARIDKALEPPREKSE